MFWSRKKKSAASSQPSPPPLPLGKGHPGTFEEPKNDLERALMAVRNREIDTVRFVEYFLNSDVFVTAPTDQFTEADGKFRLVRNPRIFSIQYPEYPAICFYTHLSRLRPTCEQYPQFRLAAEVMAGDFIMSISSSFGIVINPYWDVNLEWTVEQIDRLKKSINR